MVIIIVMLVMVMVAVVGFGGGWCEVPLGGNGKEVCEHRCGDEGGVIAESCPCNVLKNNKMHSDGYIYSCCKYGFCSKFTL